MDEKLGHVFIYSQKDIQLMQYHKLNDILKELPLFNLNKNRYGFLTPSLSATKAIDRKSTRLNSSHSDRSRMPSSA